MSTSLFSGCGGESPRPEDRPVTKPVPSVLRLFPSPLAMFIQERKEQKRRARLASIVVKNPGVPGVSELDPDAVKVAPDADEKALAEIGRAEKLLAIKRGDEAVNILRSILSRESLPSSRRAEAAFMLATACAGQQGAGDPAERLAEMNRLLQKTMKDEEEGTREARERFAALLLADQVLQAEGEDPDRFFAEYGKTE